MKLEYIKANDIYFHPQEAGVQDPRKREGCFYPVCYIKKISFGRWQIDYYDSNIYAYPDNNNNQLPASRLIIYPSGIQEIKYNE